MPTGNFNQFYDFLIDFICLLFTKNISQRFIGESGRQIDDVIKICHFHRIGSYHITVDFEKTF